METQRIQFAAHLHRVEMEAQTRYQHVEREVRELKEAKEAEAELSRAEPRELPKATKVEFHSPRSDPGYLRNPVASFVDVFGKWAPSPSATPRASLVGGVTLATSGAMVWYGGFDSMCPPIPPKPKIALSLHPSSHVGIGYYGGGGGVTPAPPPPVPAPTPMASKPMGGGGTPLRPLPSFLLAPTEVVGSLPHPRLLLPLLHRSLQRWILSLRP